MDHGGDEPEEPLRQEIGCGPFRGLLKEGVGHVPRSLVRPRPSKQQAQGIAAPSFVLCLLAAQVSHRDKPSPLSGVCSPMV